MTPPTLLEAARNLLDHISEEKPCPNGLRNGGFAGDGKTCGIVRELEAAIAREEAKPKVERVFVGRFRGGNGQTVIPKEGDWDIYAERPVPAPPKEPSIEERIRKNLTPGENYEFTHFLAKLQEDAVEAYDAEIRRLKKEHP